jgi:hypothetical protein
MAAFTSILIMFKEDSDREAALADCMALALKAPPGDIQIICRKPLAHELMHALVCGIDFTEPEIRTRLNR